MNEGVQASWLALVIGALMAVLGELFAGPLTMLLAGGSGAAQHAAEHWFRIAVVGLPGVLLVLAGNGWMRGVQRDPATGRHRADRQRDLGRASPLLVYAAGLGLDGSAIANIAAQAVGGVLFVLALTRSTSSLRPHAAIMRAQLRVGRDLIAALSGVPGRLPVGGRRRGADGHRSDRGASDRPAVVGVHRAAARSVAIAAQSLVGAALGGRRRRPGPRDWPGGWRATGWWPGPALRSSMPPAGR